MKVKKIFNSQVTTTDLIKQVRASPPTDHQNILNAQLEEIKKELRSTDSNVIQVALQKLFFIKMENVDLRQLDFQIVNCLSSQVFGPKRLACLQIPVSIDPMSQSLFMATNLFKKEMKKPNEVEVSCILSCVTNIVSADMAPLIIDEAIKLLKSQKQVLRKKSMALIAKIFTVAPQTIQGNLETILDQVVLKEDNPTVLACFTSIVNCVLNTQPKLYPLFVKPLYEIIQKKQRSNWFMIKMIKTFHKMIKIEPRLVKKLSDIYSELLQQTKSKALEYELLNTIVDYFKEEASLYELACDKLKILMEHDDANLQQLGFNLLKKMVSTNPNIINEYKIFLIDTLKGTNDFYTKLQILEIFQQYMNKQLFKEFVEVVIEQVYAKLNNKITQNNQVQFTKFQQKAITCVLQCTSANDYEIVTDHNWLLSTLIFKLTRLPLSQYNAQLIQTLIYDLVVRVEGLNKPVFNLACTILADPKRSRESIDETEDKRKAGAKNPLPAAEIIFQTLIFLIGEYSFFFKNGEEVLKIMDLIDNIELLRTIPLSSSDIQVSLFKCLVRLAKAKQGNSLDSLNKAIKKFMTIISKLKEVQSGSIFEVSLESNLLVMILKKNGENQEEISEEGVQQIISQDELFLEFEPVHPDAWKYVTLPEGVDLTEPVQKDPQEVEKITNKCKEFLTFQSNKPQQNGNNSSKQEPPAQSEKQEKAEENGAKAEQDQSTIRIDESTVSELENSTQILNKQENQEITEQEQKVYTVKKFVLPNGIQNKKKSESDEEED